jgi:hypothetical protein
LSQYGVFRKHHRLIKPFYRRYIFGLHISFKLLRQQSNFAGVLAMSSNVITAANLTNASRTLTRASSKKPQFLLE